MFDLTTGLCGKSFGDIHFIPAKLQPPHLLCSLCWIGIALSKFVSSVSDSVCC